jgi:hypothetical protein
VKGEKEEEKVVVVVEWYVGERKKKWRKGLYIV